MATLDLRPLSLGELLDRTFSVYRRNFALFLGIASIPYLFLIALMTLAAVLIGLSLPFAAASARHAPLAGPALAGLVGGALFASLIFGAAFALSAAAAVFAVSEIYAGRKPTILASLRLAVGRTWAILGVLVLIALISMAGLIVFIVPGIYFGCRLSVAIASALVEGIGPTEAIRRSLNLTKDFAGRAFLILLLTVCLSYAAMAVFQMPFFILIAASAKNPAMVMVWTGLMEIGNLTGSILVAPVSAIAFALLYYDLRVRKEAFDLQLMMQAIGPDPMPPPIVGGVPSAFGRDAS